MSDQKVCPTCGTEYPLSERFCPRDGTALRATNPQGDLLGSIIAERYHVLKKLGEGGMGTVYLAEHVKMGRKAALKVMNPGMNQDADAIARFNREAANASRLSHPNICGIYDFGETADGLIYLAMEYIEGVSLSSLIEQSGSLAPARAASIIHQSADALQVAHDVGIVHRDLKPDNIMIAKGRDGSDNAKVVDFGIAKASSSDAQKVTKTGLVVGTPEYMSPEQLAGDKLDGRSDIYSLGLVAFNCLTGKLPFPSNSAQEAMIMRLTDHPKTLAEIRPDITWPDELEAVIAKALARDAVDRYQSAAEFGRDMYKATENMPATIAAAAGTQVIGSGAAVAAAAAKTAATPAAVPKTRVAGPGDRGGAATPVSAPLVEAPAKKGGLPMAAIAAAVVILLGGGGFVAMQMLGGNKSADAGQTAGAPTTTSPQNTQSTQTPGGGGAAIPPAPAGGTGGTTPASKQMPNPGTTPATNPGTNPGRSGGAPAGSGAGPENFDEKISAWKEWTDGTKTDEIVGKAVSDINATLPRMTGVPKARAYFYLANAFFLQTKNEAGCDALKKGRDVPGASESSITSLMRQMDCK